MNNNAPPLLLVGAVPHRHGPTGRAPVSHLLRFTARLKAEARTTSLLQTDPAAGAFHIYSHGRGKDDACIFLPDELSCIKNVICRKKTPDSRIQSRYVQPAQHRGERGHSGESRPAVRRHRSPFSKLRSEMAMLLARTAMRTAPKRNAIVVQRRFLNNGAPVRGSCGLNSCHLSTNRAGCEAAGGPARCPAPDAVRRMRPRQISP
jgi:hypothetical protein